MGTKKETSVGCNNYHTKSTALSLPFFWNWTLPSCCLPCEKFIYPLSLKIQQNTFQSDCSVWLGLRTVTPAMVTCSHLKSPCPLSELVTTANTCNTSFSEASWKTGPQIEQILIFLGRRLSKHSSFRKMIFCHQKELLKLTSLGELLRGQR